MSRAQSAFEYILLIAIVLLVVVSGISLIFNYSQKSNEEVKLSSVNKIGVDLIDTVEKVYYVGGDSWETIRFNVPDGVKAFYILNNYEVIIEYDSYGGLSQAVFYSDINITTPYSGGGISNISSFFHPGLNQVKVASRGNFVEVQEIT